MFDWQSGWMKKICAMILLSSLLACAQAPVKSASSGSSKNPPNGLIEQEVKPLTNNVVDPLPVVPLSKEILYSFIVAEIAAQRGFLSQAFATEYELAQRTRDPRIAQRATEFAAIDRQPAAILQGARLWKELAPHSEDASNTLLNMLITSGRLDEAEPLLRLKISAAQPRSQAIAGLYGFLVNAPNKQQAFALLEQLVSNDLDLPETHLVLAQMARASGDLKRALQEAHMALALRPDWARAALLLAQYLSGQSMPQAIDVLARFVQRFHGEDVIDVRITLARMLIIERRVDEATRQFELILKQGSNNPQMLYTLGGLAYQAGKSDIAEQFFKRFVADLTNGDGERDSDNQNLNLAYLYLAQIAEERGDFPIALDWLDQVQGGNEFIVARGRRATMLARIGRLEQAREELHALPAATDRERVTLIQIEAQILRDANQTQAAFDLLADAIEKFPKQLDLLYDYGLIAEKLNKLDVMESSLRTLMRLRPDAAQAYNALGYTWADRNMRLPEALELITKALTLAPDDASILDSMGWVHYRLQNYPLALDYLQRAYAARADVEIAAHLGEVLWINGQQDQAEKILTAASRKEPLNEVLRATLIRLGLTRLQVN